VPERVRRRVNWPGVVTLAGGLLLWEAAVRSSAFEFAYLPPPSGISKGLREIVSTGELQINLIHTLTAVLAGWLLAAGVGITLGTVLGLFRPVWRYSMASLEALRALPVVAFVPVAVLLLGLGLNMEIAVAFFAALWPILINTYGGLRSIDPRLVEVGRVLGLSRFEGLRKLRLPAATAFIMVGLRLGLAVSFIMTLVAEMVGNPAGLGFAILSKGQALRPEQMFAYVLVVGLSGVVLNSTLVAVSRVMFPGHMAATGDTA
jgi:ABC-type nitrate/sulfonate/bicarbonate transport system permease component